jgi:hypothetical protein
MSEPDVQDQQPPDGKQKRQAVRYKVNCAARLMLPGSDIVRVRGRDISDGGAGFAFEQQIPVKQAVSLEINPWCSGRNYLIRAQGVITYNQVFSAEVGFCHGIKFTNLPDQYKKTLDELLQKLARAQGG